MAKAAINPRVLAWAMEDSDRGVQELAVATSRDRQVVEAWLAGSDDPHLGDVRKLADLLGRSPYFFSLPEPPERLQYAAQFRTALKGTNDRDKRASELASLRWAQRIQNRATGLAKEHFEAPQVGQDTESAAEEVRTWLGWATAQQVKATSKVAAFRLLRAAIEERNILVTLKDSGSKSFCGFCLPSSELPLIFVNKSYDLASVRSYTLVHELAHVLHGERRICYGGDKGVERWCNRFAAAFLMPQDHLLEYWAKQQLSFDHAEDTEPVRRVANRYKISWEAAAIRLEDLGLASHACADFVRSTRPEPPPADGWAQPGSRNTATMRVEEFGAAFTRILGEAVAGSNISDLDARKQLRVDGRQFAQVLSLVRSGEQGAAIPGASAGWVAT